MPLPCYAISLHAVAFLIIFYDPPCDLVVHATWIYMMSEKKTFYELPFLYSHSIDQMLCADFHIAVPLPDEIFMCAFELIQILL